jgi:nitric oxide reductase large subunit
VLGDNRRAVAIPAGGLQLMKCWGHGSYLAPD